MPEKSVSQETRDTIPVLFILIVIGFLTGWFAKELLQIDDDTVIMFLIFLPFLGYVIFSGRLSELKAPGFEAKLVTVARQKVELAYEKIDEPSLGDIEIVTKGGTKYLYEEIIPNLDKSKPAVMPLTLGKGFYDQRMLLDYIKALSSYQTVKFVVFSDQEGKIVAYASLWQLLRILEDYSLGASFIEKVNANKVQSLKKYPGIITRTISTKSTNIEALQEMNDQNLEAIVVVDEAQRLKGIIQREQILTKLMLSLAR